MSRRPNLLLITTDQHRWDWLGCHGTPGVETPNIDALAARGVRFTHHVTNSSLCAPARIGLATGLTPMRLGTLTNSDVLLDGVPTYYQALRDAGYRVGVVGKLDLNKPDQDNGASGARPETFAWGFTDPVEIEGKMHAAMTQPDAPLGPYGFWLREQGLFDGFVRDYHERLTEIVNHNYRSPDQPAIAGTRFFDDSVLPSEAFADSYIGQRACAWLRDVPAGEPWHLFVSFVGPHDPFDPPTEYAARFRDSPVPMPVLDPGEGRPEPIRRREYGNTVEQLLSARRQYTASLALIDDQVGSILAALDAEGLADDTVVVFTADHGEMLGDHRLFQKNVPYEPAMRIPLLICRPGDRGAVSDALTELVDVTATLLELAGVEPPDPFDGRSLVASLDAPGREHRDAVTVCEAGSRTIRTRSHKYVHHVGDAWDTHELYDLDDDPHETTNRIDAERDLAADLRVELAGIIGPEALESPG